MIDGSKLKTSRVGDAKQPIDIFCFLLSAEPTPCWRLEGSWKIAIKNCYNKVLSLDSQVGRFTRCRSLTQQ